MERFNRPMRILTLLFAFCLTVFADGPADNTAEKVRPVPPPGIQLSDSDRKELEAAVAELGRAVAPLREKKDKRWPDVEIFHKALRWAVQYDEIFSTNEVRAARDVLKAGLERVKELGEGRAPWTTQTGLVVRGYVSKIDGSVQPYGLVVPESWAKAPNVPHRLDTWFHGRDEKLSELNFVSQRMRSAGEFTPPSAFVLHLYGRYCNANKMAGEIDLLEALDDVKANYNIDENRIIVRGFSMGGAAAWQFATHYASKWAAAAPGAGFSETPDFLKVFQNEKVEPAPWERTLWHWYDCTDWALNLFNLPTVAYSGEIDKQKQAADIMAAALAKEGLKLTHIIGPNTPHRYEPGAKAEINRRIDAIARLGRDPVPRDVRFTTWTLRYNEMFWVKLDGMEEHWKRARIHARIVDGGRVEIATENATALTLEMAPGYAPFDVTKAPAVVIDGKRLFGERIQTDRSWRSHFRKIKGNWRAVSDSKPAWPGKIPGLQGPIDDAFMDSFVMVEPTGSAFNEKTGAWYKSEFAHATDHWRKQFRGDARVVKDDAVTDEIIAQSNLVLWGDPQSNKLLARILDKLPIQWTSDAIKLGSKSYSSATHVPALIFPNPLNPQKYVVLNSGFTFREYDYLNNARQVAKLPDYAIIDTATPVTSRAPGAIAAAGFFNEYWQLK